jgi:hypothetical protein
LIHRLFHSPLHRRLHLLLQICRLERPHLNPLAFIILKSAHEFSPLRMMLKTINQYLKEVTAAYMLVVGTFDL